MRLKDVDLKWLVRAFTLFCRLAKSKRIHPGIEFRTFLFLFFGIKD